MTESDIDAIVSFGSELKADELLIVLLGSPEGIKGVSKKLRNLNGARKIRKGLFISSCVIPARRYPVIPPCKFRINIFNSALCIRNH